MLPRDNKELATECPLAAALAGRLRSARAELTTRWLERIAARVAIERDRVFPGEELLDHIPLLIDGIADYVEDPADEVAADAPAVAKPMNPAGRRYGQGSAPNHLSRKSESLAAVPFAFLRAPVTRSIR